MRTLVVNRKEQVKAFQENMEWFTTHYTELKRGYHDKFVAINNQKLIDADSDAFRLIDRLRKEYVDLRAFAIEHITGDKVDLIL